LSCPATARKIPPRPQQAVAGFPLPAAMIVENQPAKSYPNEETDNRKHLDD
jgi:hypothetical protein